MEWNLDLVPEGDIGGFRIPNLPDEDFRQVLVDTPNQSSPLSTKIKLVELHHGRMVHDRKPCEATLLLLEMAFISTIQKRRYESVTVTMGFLDAAGTRRLHPEIVGLAPKGTRWMNKTAHDKTTRYGGTVGGRGGVDFAGVEAGAHWEVETTKPAKFKATITGRTTTSKDYYGAENVAVWSMDENKGERDGIPTFMQVAVLVKRTGPRPFLATVDVSSDVDIQSETRRSLPFTTDRDKVIDPVTVTPGKVQLCNSSITNITDEDLEHMERLEISRYFRVNLVEDEEPSSWNEPLAGSVIPQTNPEKAAGAGGAQANAPASPAREASPTLPSQERAPAISPRITTSSAPTPSALMTQSMMATLTVAAEAVSKAAEAASKAAEAASKAAEAAAKSADAAATAAGAVVKTAEALAAVAAATAAARVGHSGVGAVGD